MADGILELASEYEGKPSFEKLRDVQTALRGISERCYEKVQEHRRSGDEEKEKFMSDITGVVYCLSTIIGGVLEGRRAPPVAIKAMLDEVFSFNAKERREDERIARLCEEL